MTERGKGLFKVRFGFEDKLKVTRRYKDREGKGYGVMLDGSVRRLTRLKPWSNKSERRQVLRRRREDRALAARNLEMAVS